jgi:Phosphodiester glycosidase
VAPRRAAALALAWASLAASGGAAFSRVAGAQAAALPASSLAVRVDGAWHTWWRSGAAPGRWTAADPTLDGAVRWTRAADGVEVGELRLAGTGEAWRIRATLVRLTPVRVEFGLALPRTASGLFGRWSVDSMPADATLAFNAGQFARGEPWGWIVRDGVEVQPPDEAPLATAVMVDAAGTVRLLGPAETAAARAAGGARQAFQSYPTLLAGDGEVPAPLRAPERGVDVGHRDSRLALGILRDGRVLVLLTRFDALGDATGAFARLPMGPTVPELAALMGALGCTRAVALDGGISGQLAVRDGAGRVRAWPGLRDVPLAVVVRRRR